LKAKGYKRIPAKIVKKIRIQRSYHEGLIFHEGNIWVANGKNGKVWVLDPETGSILKSIEPPGTFTEAIAWREGGVFFVTDWDERKIYKVRIEDDKMNLEAEYSFGDAHPTGVAWDGSSIFVITWTRGMGTKFHIIRMSDKFEVIARLIIATIQEPDQLAWDGKNLWITSWHGRRVYKIDVASWKIIGSFKSPIRDTTGITWDGKYFWLTGTGEDLYQMELGE